MKRSVCYILPVRNEEKSIVSVISELKSISEQLDLHVKGIIVVDDSSDNSRSLALEAGAEVLEGEGVGLGYAMIKGLNYSLSKNADCIISLDSDGQVDASEIGRFSRYVLEENYDLVLGSRFMSSDLVDYNYPQTNKIGIRLLRTYLSLATKMKITDSHGGIRSMSPNALKDLCIKGTHTYVQETIVDIYQRGNKIIEIPSRWNIRESGESRVVSSKLRYAFKTAPYLFLKAPLAFILTPFLLFKYWRDQ